ncbi:MAG: polysaccharide biosynthesis C-terminal domain-containing protein [Clostridia bacterium]|nr:polysaccharide biosynthesis C-terminal domain-containing protein [Clostridia bacterium]
MAEDKRYKKLMGNTAVIGLGQLGSKVLVYLLVRLYTAVMSAEEYSIASNLTETATLLIPLLSLGIGEAVFRFGMDRNFNKKDVFSGGFVAALMGALMLVAVIPILCSIPYMQGREWLILTYVFSSILHTICSQFLRAEGRFKLYAVQGLLNTALVITFNIIFLIPLKMSYIGYVLSVAVADFLATVFMVVAAKLWRHFNLRAVRGSTLKEMLKYSIPMIPANIFWWITNVSDRYMVTWYLGDAANGLYSASYKIPTLMMTISGIFVTAWRNSAVDERESKDSAAFYERVFAVFSSVVFLMAGCIIAFAKVITVVMFDPSYGAAWSNIPVLTLAMVFFNLVSFLGSLYVAEKKSLYSFFTSMAGAAVNILLNLLLIPTKLGAMGAAMATFASYLVVFFLRVWTAKKIKPFRMHLVRIGLNSLLVVAQTAVILWSFPGWMAVEGVLLAVVIVLNCKPILQMAKMLLGGRGRRSPSAVDEQKPQE